MRKLRRVNVTDHALIRWLERHHGIDMEQFREQLADVVRDAVSRGAVGLQKDGLTYIISGDTLVTVTDGRSVSGTKSQFQKMGLIAQ